ncbi:TOBE domain-containing protein [Devosia sp. MC521]|uniref:TOBE domain-containing protein n=1 Tax=Devosia sp. MC521 TaxID=2759954 RepID=UPI0020BF29D2|nr:TOBE domain-containing protein [Devosia sp. MC521]
MPAFEAAAANTKITTGLGNITSLVRMLNNAKLARDLALILVHDHLLVPKLGAYRRYSASTGIFTGKAVLGQKVTIGIRPEHFCAVEESSERLTATAQVVEQLGGVSYVYAVGSDGETKLTIQQKGHARITNGAHIDVGIEAGAALAFDTDGARL